MGQSRRHAPIEGLGGALEIFSGQNHTQDLAPYNVNTQQTRTRFWDGHDQMFRDDVSWLKGNHLFQFGGQYQHNFNWHQRTDNGGGINYQPVYELGMGTSGSGLNVGSAFVRARRSYTELPCSDSAALGIDSISQVAYTRTVQRSASHSRATPHSTRAPSPITTCTSATRGT